MNQARLLLVMLGVFAGIGASTVGARAFEFIAPTVPSTSSAPNETGLIVFDSGTNSFRGRSSDGTWHPLSNEASNVIIPVGTILPFAGATVPFGFLLCDGSDVSRASYPLLFTALGTSWGAGDGSSSFSLPDLRGRFLRGVDGGIDNDPDRTSRTALKAGGAIGDAVGSYQLDAFKLHHHSTTFPRYWSGGGGGLGGDQSYFGDVTYNTTDVGGSETRPKNAYVNYIIKAF